MLFVAPGFLTAEDCRLLIDAMEVGLCGSSQHLSEFPPGAIRRRGSRTEIDGSALASLMSGPAHSVLERAREEAVDIMAHCHRLSRPLYPDLTLFTEMRIGDFHVLHADRERRTADGWVPNHVGWRDYTALIYLNGAPKFIGGQLRLPNVGVSVDPDVGLLVGMPCDHRYEHEVTSVESGRRLTLAIWMTHDVCYREDWPNVSLSSGTDGDG